MEYDVIVVGGGAAGLICAGRAAQLGKNVLVAEKMERPARKILVTGKGRCNVTNDCTREGFFGAVKTNSKFLFSTYESFTAQDAMELFEELGVPLKVERGNRVFPVSERAMDIADALVKYAKKNGAKIEQKEAKMLLVEDRKIKGIETTSGENFFAKSIVIATGGRSYPKTGSTGDGYRLAKEVGHMIVPTKPSLIPIITKEDWCAQAMGLSLKNVELTVTQRGKKAPAFKQQGEMLFTHFGVSGPLVLSATAHMGLTAENYQLSIDLKPALDKQQLDQRLLRDFSENINKDFANSLDKLLPRLLIPIVVRISGIGEGTKVNAITKEQRQNLVEAIKGLTLNPIKLRPIEEAVITSGGVKVSEINPKTMESKIVSGLFFAGEVIDLDAYTGGFNLQIAYSTGYGAGTYC